jgi:hypothetical protein
MRTHPGAQITNFLRLKPSLDKEISSQKGDVMSFRKRAKTRPWRPCQLPSMLSKLMEGGLKELCEFAASTCSLERKNNGSTNGIGGVQEIF